MRARTGKILLAMASGGLVVVGLAAPALWAQDGAPPRPAPRALEPRNRIEIDGFGASIGASVRDVSAEEGQRAKLSPPEGAVVTNVRSGGPAEKAGIAAGDIIVEFDGERVRSARQLSRLVRESPEGRAVKSVVVRDGNRRTLDLTPDDNRAVVTLPDFNQLERQMRDLAQQRWQFDYQGPGGRGWGGWVSGSRGRLGVSLTAVSDQLAMYFGVQRGALVTWVDMDSPAARAGLKAGDVITMVNGRNVEDASDVLDEVRRAESGGSIAITAMRDRKEVKLTVKMPEVERPARPGRSI